MSLRTTSYGLRVMYGHTDLKRGVAVEIDGAPHQVLESSHIAMGRGGAVMRTKLRNLLTGSVVEKSFRSSDKIPPANLNRVNMQYLYHEGSSYYFMHQKTYEQISLDKRLIGEGADYLAEGSKAIVLYFGQNPIGVDIGNTANLKVTKTEPGIKGDTATSALKPAITETGAQVMVPLFINEGDVIKVDTRSGSYLERQK